MTILILKAIRTKRMRPIFAGNLEYDTRQSELERLFSKYGRIDRVDMKSGKALPVCIINQSIFSGILFLSICH